MLLILLALLDLHAATAAAPPSAALPVKLEIDRDESRYRITHQYRGDKPMRFVTGATDRNCDDPMDVLVIDDKVEQLHSMLPCGGFAFRATRLVKPGEEWKIEGQVWLAPGPHKVIARYCVREESLKAIAPAERDTREPAWWLHCAESPPLKLEASALDTWQRLLAAMRAGDLPAMAQLTTPAGMASLRKGVHDEPETTAFARWGKGWAAWGPPRWRKRSADRAEAALGPEAKAHGLSFIKSGADWRLDRWTPGE
jgi:hypothetical protein